ncbi:MAG: NADH-quinone oxidoreductase subunit L [Rickettsiaceae bacterium]|nr:NADH-quinone oxidoreductase subunit L [Rickettsiaceae bacterium]MDP4832543.1 NADH-quinone oxidoreductase subunit L [Rickettsiaceae bacterium]MDP5082889.1 NADH-quinone oxidoreductase subunit L [Rickettsiaceae bacterium]
MELALKLIIFLPLISGLANGIFCKKISNNLASKIASAAIIVTAICAILVFTSAGVRQYTFHVILASWIKYDNLTIDWAIYVDQLTAIMFLLVTTVSAVVHVYSLGYMSDDKNLPKFLSYLSLFTFFMLSLVSADNFLQLFFGWEGVGLCSYLLIGYYYQKESANNAAIKAFVVNRVGDFAFIIGIVMIVLYTGSIDFESVFTQSDNLANVTLEYWGYEIAILDITCLMLFLGCMGKSAQIGMHVWLPDAMEGPTPVSALIHAATMVTAGVFLVARCSFMFEYSPYVLQIITIIGAVTCLFAALVAIAQTDIKKIIAYSTCSQLGYMFFACGVSAYQAGVFHLVTHGFFKALLFLSAGSVIHACHEQDVFKMGGLRKKMPITYANFWVGSLAIVGIFPFAGFYSKDLVLESAYAAGGVGNFAFILGIVAAILTAIYSLKIIILTFHGKTKLTKDAFEHVHESPKIMNLPLLVLVAGALFSGMIGYYILGISNPHGFFSGSIFNLQVRAEEHHVALGVQLLPLVVGLLGMVLGWYVYRGTISSSIANKMKLTYGLLKNKFFFDEIYNKVFVRTTKCLSSLAGIFDVKIIDRFGPNGFSVITRGCSWCICQIQTGYMFNYAFYIIFAMVLCVTLFVANYLHGAWGI